MYEVWIAKPTQVGRSMMAGESGCTVVAKCCLYAELEWYTWDFALRRGAHVRQWIDDLGVLVAGSRRHVRDTLPQAILKLRDGLREPVRPPAPTYARARPPTPPPSRTPRENKYQLLGPNTDTAV